MCEYHAQQLNNKINTRQPAVVTDAELSILKVAEMEILERTINPLPPEPETYFSHSSRGGNCYPKYSLIVIFVVLNYFPYSFNC